MKRTEFGQRLRDARLKAGLTQPELAKIVGISQSTLSELEIKAHSSGYTPQLAQALGIDATELATGQPGNLMSRKSVTQNSPSASDVAQFLSVYKFTVPPTITKEELMSGKELAPEFVLHLFDDALAPKYPKGTEVVWSTTKRPSVESLVLLMDQHGQAHARIYAQGRSPDHWSAQAENRAYTSFNAGQDQIRVLAVGRYAELP